MTKQERTLQSKWDTGEFDANDWLEEAERQEHLDKLECQEAIGGLLLVLTKLELTDYLKYQIRSASSEIAERYFYGSYD